MENISDDVIVGRCLAILKGIFGSSAVPQVSAGLEERGGLVIMLIMEEETVHTQQECAAGNV